MNVHIKMLKTHIPFVMENQEITFQNKKLEKKIKIKSQLTLSYR